MNSQTLLMTNGIRIDETRSRRHVEIPFMTYFTNGIVSSTRRRGNHGPSTPLHKKSSIEESFGSKLRFRDVVCNRVPDTLFSKALMMKRSGTEVISIWLLQRQDLLARRQEYKCHQIPMQLQ